MCRYINVDSMVAQTLQREEKHKKKNTNKNSSHKYLIVPASVSVKIATFSSGNNGDKLLVVFSERQRFRHFLQPGSVLPTADLSTKSPHG